jgi:type VI secretion system protein ImpM
MASGYFPAGCLGKLPSFGDFVRHNATAREVLAYDDWLHHGLFHAQNLMGTEWGQAFMDTPAYNFLFWPDNADRFLVGIMCPSHDKSNRWYPFVVSVLVDRLRYGNRGIHLIPVLFADFLSRAHQFVRRAMNGLEMKTLADEAQALSIPVLGSRETAESDYTQFLERTLLREFCRQVLGQKNGSLNSTVLENLAEILSPLRDRSLARLTIGLQFPLSSSVQSGCTETSFWVQLSMRLLNQTSGMPILFWTADERQQGSRLFLFFRQPSPKIFAQLVRPAMESDTMCVLADQNSLPARGSVAARHRELLEKGEVTLQGYLSRL